MGGWLVNAADGGGTRRRARMCGGGKSGGGRECASGRGLDSWTVKEVIRYAARCHARARA